MKWKTLSLLQDVYYLMRKSYQAKKKACVCIHVCVYVYKEREREEQNNNTQETSMQRTPLHTGTNIQTQHP